jgi:putative toxin-antitoxin system antitoxin component (TIGR02293 family)
MERWRAIWTFMEVHMERAFAQPKSIAGPLREAQMPIWGLQSAISKGLPREALLDVAHEIWIDPVESNKLVHAIVPKSSLSRRGTLTPAQGEQTERLHRLFQYACRVFGDDGDARLFMQRPHPELEGRRPVDAALSELGGRMVESVLDALYYGLPV